MKLPLFTRACPKKSKSSPSGGSKWQRHDRSYQPIFDSEFSGKGRAAVVYAAGDAINRAILP